MPGTLRPLVGARAAVALAARRRREATPAQGPRRGRVGLLPGCVQSVVFGDVNTATARVLAADGFEVVAPREQGAAARSHVHAGRREDGTHARRASCRDVRARRRRPSWSTPRAAASSVKEYGQPRRRRRRSPRACATSPSCSPSGPQAERHPLALSVAFQDSCHLAARAGHARRSRAPCSPRSRASSCASRPSRRSAAAAPASTTSSSPRRPPSSARRRRSRCWRRGRRLRQREPGLPDPGRHAAPARRHAAARVPPGRARRRVDPRPERRAARRPRAALGVVPDSVVHPGLLGGWSCQATSSKEGDPDEVAR